MNHTDRTKVRRVPKRGSQEPRDVFEILDAGFLAHVGFNVDGQPFVVPTLYGRKDDVLYLHGSSASRMMLKLEAGIPACVTVTLVDGLVLARSAFHHSMNYRSVMAFGIARKIDDQEEKLLGLQAISDHLIAGRWDDVRYPTEKELKATALLAFQIEEASAKVRRGEPIDDEEDYGLNVWAGVLPLELTPKAPVPDSRLLEGIDAPEYVVRYSVR
ncbi:MAG TPA: pyridoxamine 5'-phosphate oxidase family protein [Candidatus Angelobacter sp.]|nr:pyridoxamine 5'-phosphate oxidase family protein [Candidatus Angelobacter sp.]